MRSAVLPQKVDSSKMAGKRETDFSVKGIIGIQQVSNSTGYSKITTSIHNHVNHGNTDNKNRAATYNFTKDDILQYFFGKVKYTQAEKGRSEGSLSDDKKLGGDESCAENNATCCGVCQQKTSEQCPVHGPLQSLRKLVNTDQHTPEMKSKVRVTYAVASFPPEVQLCESSIPGHFYGVCARHFIPVGTWIGPYEGVRVSADDIPDGMDMSHMWEVFKDGRICSYLDGQDENVSSWMRFIRCARHKHEQNLFIFQYGDNIYYRAYKDISPGSELLVWYDDQYEKFLGIPIRLRHMNPALVGQVYPQDINHTASTKDDSNYPPSSRVPPTQPLHCDTQFQATTQKNDIRPKSPSNESKTVSPKTAEIMKETADTRNSGCGRTSPRNGESSESLEAGVWRCGQCFKSFTQRSLLQIHVCPRLPEKPYQCGHCTQSFAHPTDLRTHVVTHNSERPFKCGFCARSFAGSTTLNNHIRTHTGQKPFVCEKCSRSFSQASQLSRHQRLPGDCCHRNTVY